MSTGVSGPSEGMPIQLMCPTCGAKYALPKYEQGKRYGCKRCSASLMFGKFALLQELGRGGFGVVYKAWQADLERVVALKFLQSDSQESTERFTREARIAANLAHPNITPIYEVGQHESKLYITMLFVDGMTTNKSKFSLREAAQVIRDAALAVDFAHARNIIHRDIKPHNIMVTREEASGTSPGDLARRVYVMDFGLARSVEKGGTLTTDGQILGTPAFMSPEQAEGKTLDARSDVYSLGATLYSLATQRAPFEANTPVQVLMLVATGTPISPSKHNPEIDPNLEGIILKAMARKPEDRYPTASRLAQDLNRYLQGVVTDAGPTVHISSKTLPSTVTKKKSRALPIAVGLLLMLVGAAGLLKLFVLKDPPDQVVKAPDTTPRPNPEKTDPAPKIEPPPFVPPKPAPKLVLEVRTHPEKATVKIQGLQDKLSPCTYDDQELQPGTYTLEIAKTGWEPAFETVVLKPGAEHPPVVKKLERPKDPDALVLESVPPGAKIRIDNADIGKKTPASIPRSFIGDKDRVVVTLELKGFGLKSVPVNILGTVHEEKILLDPQTGSLAVQKAPPGAKIVIFAIPEGLKDPKPRDLCLLWSENSDSLEAALDALDPKDAPLVAERLNQLKTHPEPRISTRAKKLAVASEAKTPFRPEQSLTADDGGVAVWDKAWVSNVYRILATLPTSRDFVSNEVHVLEGLRSDIPVAMTALVPVSAGVRPPRGHFLVTGADGKTLRLEPGTAAVRVPAGRVAIRFMPPANDPLLREFTIIENVSERYEVTGNLYLMTAQSVEKQDPGLVIRIYTSLLGDATSAPEDREKLPALVQAMVKAQVEAAGAKGGQVVEPAKALEAAAKKKPEESVAPLTEVWAAKNSPREVKAGAAASLAFASAKLKRPYEAMEWIERCVAAGMDPSPEVQLAVETSVRGYPGLAERLSPVQVAIAALRQAASRKPGFHGLKVVEVVGGGVRVEGVAKGGPADAAGIQFRDLLVEFGGAPLKVPADLEEALRARAEGDEVEVKIVRDGEKKGVLLKLAAVPATPPEYLVSPAPPAPQPPTPAPVPVRVGTFNSTKFGDFVKLDKGAEVKIGDALEVVRKDAVVADLLVTRLLSKDPAYPNGAALVKISKGKPERDDEVRKKP